MTHLIILGSALIQNDSVFMTKTICHSAESTNIVIFNFAICQKCCNSAESTNNCAFRFFLMTVKYSSTWIQKN